MANVIPEDQIGQALLQRLQAAAWRLNPQIPVEGYGRALFQAAKCDNGDNVFHLLQEHAAQGRKWAA